MILGVLLIFVSILSYILVIYKKPQNLPPGEWGFPVLGYLPYTGERTGDMVRRLRLKHGNTFCVKIGVRLFVFITDFSTIKNSFGKLEFAGRPQLFTFNIFNYFRDVGFLTTVGHTWLTNRKFVLRVLGNFGMGKSKLEENINVEVISLMEELKKRVGEPMKMNYTLNVTVINVLWSLVSSKRFERNDKVIHKFSKMIHDNFHAGDGSAMILNLFPWLIPFMPKFTLNWMKINMMETSRDEMIDFMMEMVKEHIETLNEDDPRDYIDMYLIEMKQHKDDINSIYDKDFHNLSASMLQLFLTGSDTTSSSIRWYLLFMVKYPEIQKKIHREISSVVAHNRFPALEDKEKLPYFEASIYEALRRASLVPTCLPHETMEDVIIDGHTVPKGTIVAACIEICHNNPDYWERPNDFYPEHFINEEGKFYIRKEGFLPFSQGRRQCLGESLAKMQMFLILGAILQRFTISEPEEQNMSLEPDSNISLINFPQDFNILLQENE